MIRIVCGLGNPGEAYRGTRHNLGFDIIDRLAARRKLIRAGEHRFFHYRAIDTAGRITYLIQPQIFVNRSGRAVAEALQLFEAEPAELFVIGDDFNLPLGRLRIRRSGSAGGHKGLISIIERIGHGDFPRLRAGIGPLPVEADDHDAVTEFVLGRFLTEEKEVVEEMISRAVEAVDLVLNNQLDLAISKHNNANPTPGN